MDGSRFDHLAKQLVNRTDRRRVLQGVSGVVGGLVGTLTGLLGHEAVQGGKRQKRRHAKRQRGGDSQAAGQKPKQCKYQGYTCKRNVDCCTLNCCNRVCCGEGQVCSAGQQCVAAPPPPSCPTGYTNCGAQCVNLTNNPNHCGACATLCSPGERCCGGTCLEDQTDVRNCGGCGVRCRFNEQCINGVCRCGPNQEICGAGESCCPTNVQFGQAACDCRSTGGGEFLFFSSNPGDCGDQDDTCADIGGGPRGTPCVATTGTCEGSPSQVCCPSGTTCDNGTCRYA